MNGRSPLPLSASNSEWAAAPEADARRLRRLLVALSATNDAIVRAQTPQELFEQVCDAVMHGGRFNSCAVLLAVDGRQALETKARVGSAHLVPGDRMNVAHQAAQSQGLAGTAFHSAQTCVVDDLRRDPRMRPWAEYIERGGLVSGAAIPLIEAGRSIGVILLHSAEVDAFDTDTVRQLERIADNVSFSLRNFERDAERMRHAQDLLRFRTAMDMSGDAIYLIDPERMVYLDVNQTACRETGYTRDEILAINTFDLMRSSREQLAESYSQVIERGEAGLVSIEESLPKDGRIRVLELHRRAVRTGEGHWLIVSIARDVTQRHLHEKMRAMEHAATRCLARPGSARETVRAVLRIICETAGWSASGYFTVEDAHGSVRLFAGWSSLPDEEIGESVRSALRGTIAPRSALGQVAVTGEPVWIDDLTMPGSLFDDTDTDWRRSRIGQRERARLAFPVFTDGRVVGVMAFSHEQTRASDERLLRSLHVISDQLGQFMQRKRAEAVLRKSESRFRALTELSSDWYWEQDADCRFTRIGRGAGDDPQDDLAMFLGRSLFELPGLVADSADFDSHRAQLVARHDFRDFEFALRNSRGEVRWISLSGQAISDTRVGFIGYRGVSRDVTEGRKTQENITHLATHDSLTGLPNRSRFAEVLTQALEQARRHGDRLALLFIDLDRFKLINDTLGHDAGDRLLIEMSQRLRECMRASDTIARLGGDEFVVLVRNLADREDATVVARKVLDAATKPLDIDDHECQVSASVGICLYPQDGNDEQTLMKAADTAMYAAKQEGKNTYQFYTPENSAHSLARLRLESNLRRALERGELRLHYQPKVEVSSGRIIGAEALARWHDAELGDVAPADFIPMAEETGLIKTLGKWVLREACRQNVAWRDAGLTPITMSVNLSPRQFEDARLIEDIKAALHDSGMDAASLDLEITESMVVQDPKRAVSLLGAIKQMGVMLSIDDFGTGYSSLGQLKRFPIDSLKIDRAFVGEIPRDPADMALTAAIISMGQSLSLKVIAEGVETEYQSMFLRDHGCDVMQGFFYSEALPADGFAALLGRQAKLV